jgi:hypothetical protein
MSSRHRFECSSGHLTTADYLELAVISDEIPDDPQTLDDYGFSHCETWNQKSHLLGLYKGLLLFLKVRTLDLDQWRREGRLVDNIIAEFSNIPEKSRGKYFPWFLRHTHLLNDKSPPQQDL